MIHLFYNYLLVKKKKTSLARDDKKIASLTYYWNSEDATVKLAEENSDKIEVKIPIKKGENELILIAEDEAGNKETVTKKFKGATKPKIEVTQENDELIIKIKDEVKIKKIELTINGNLLSTDPNNEGKEVGEQEVEFTQKLEPGENKI